mgnify:CR=1 FL=1
MSDKTLRDLQDAVEYGIEMAVQMETGGDYGVVGVWDHGEGPVRYSDERVNVVTSVLASFFNPYTTRDMDVPEDLAVFGNAVILALDKFGR